MYSHDTNFILVGYYDVDWADNVEDRKRPSGGCFFMGNNLTSRFRKKNNCVSLSTVESEYSAVGSNCTQVLWMKKC